LPISTKQIIDLQYGVHNAGCIFAGVAF